MVTDIELGNSSAAGVAVTLNDAASTVIYVPPTSTIGKSFETPLRVAANTAFTFTPASGTTTAYCAAQGYLTDGGLV